MSTFAKFAEVGALAKTSVPRSHLVAKGIQVIFGVSETIRRGNIVAMWGPAEPHTGVQIPPSALLFFYKLNRVNKKAKSMTARSAIKLGTQ